MPEPSNFSTSFSPFSSPSHYCFAAKYLKSFFIVHHIITIYFCKGIYGISYLTNYRNTLYAFYIRRCIL
ncbi:hypothetical protein HMPREF1548_01520 [Clostridium sp. KLE 1755]|nr:hypothetical protein HMPREF1548_01520 [Clostridium sp. KLE 1755]